ncbi:PAS domain S-box-containing protein [Flexibacter flexilis DSM 6793]|uniref:PAS domain S-box-containing protein n=1 Tax=Flexibacter flexilis DSM 6793 TaxID=927664 RepID=A0A1I1MYF6_9BACT|nr:PAS domain S-box protein [Flexibacter flexilis]SFC87593.1 PAS domain S-box-containing protein [Flexibacter flexilis DSM 6793]
MGTSKPILYFVGLSFGNLEQLNEYYEVSHFPSPEGQSLSNLPKPTLWVVAYKLLDYIPDHLSQNIVVVCDKHQEEEALSHTYLTDVICRENLSIKRLWFIIEKAIKQVSRAQKHLEEKDWLSMIAQSTTDIVFILSPSGAILYISPSVTNILGYLPEELTEKLAWDFIHPRERSEVCEIFNRKEWDKTRSVYFPELHCRSKTGEWIPMEAFGGRLSAQTQLDGLIFSLRDVTTQKQTQKQLTYTEHIISQIKEAIIGTNARDEITYMNPAAETLYCTTSKEAIGKSLSELLTMHWFDPEQEQKFERDTQSLGYWQGETIHVGSTGEHIYVDMSHNTVSYTDGSLEKLLVIRDIRESKSKDFQLSVSELRFRNLVESISDLVWSTNTESVFTYISPAVEQVLGYSPDEIIGKPTWLLMPLVNVDQNMAYFQEVKSRRGSFSFYQLQFLTKDGSTVVLEMSGTPLFNFKNEWIGYQGIMQDITQRINSENQLNRNLREKETLIKEIHHRVKNNMQIISSLLFLQAQKIQDKAILELYADSQRRIKAMALVHEKLYQSPDLSRIEFNSYLQSLVSMLASSHRSSHVELMAIASETLLYLDIETAIPCGLIINELVLNCYKYAFPDGRDGKIYVTFHQDEKTGLYQLKVYDNGIGLPEFVMETSTLGMPLVKGLAGQINATFETYNDNGAVFVITFSDKTSREMPSKA